LPPTPVPPPVAPPSGAEVSVDGLEIRATRTRDAILFDVPGLPADRASGIEFEVTARRGAVLLRIPNEQLSRTGGGAEQVQVSITNRRTGKSVKRSFRVED